MRRTLCTVAAGILCFSLYSPAASPQSNQQGNTISASAVPHTSLAPIAEDTIVSSPVASVPSPCCDIDWCAAPSGHWWAHYCEEKQSHACGISCETDAPAVACNAPLYEFCFDRFFIALGNLFSRHPKHIVLHHWHRAKMCDQCAMPTMPSTRSVSPPPPHVQQQPQSHRQQKGRRAPVPQHDISVVPAVPEVHVAPPRVLPYTPPPKPAASKSKRPNPILLAPSTDKPAPRTNHSTPRAPQDQAPLPPNSIRKSNNMTVPANVIPKHKLNKNKSKKRKDQTVSWHLGNYFSTR